MIDPRGISAKHTRTEDLFIDNCMGVFRKIMAIGDGLVGRSLGQAIENPNVLLPLNMVFTDQYGYLVTFDLPQLPFIDLPPTT